MSLSNDELEALIHQVGRQAQEAGLKGAETMDHAIKLLQRLVEQVHDCEVRLLTLETYIENKFEKGERS